MEETYTPHRGYALTKTQAEQLMAAERERINNAFEASAEKERQQREAPANFTAALGSIAAVEISKDAACSEPGAFRYFYPPNHRETKYERIEREDRAKLICGTCAVRDQCLEIALSTREAYGVWGGMNEKQRNTIIDSRRRRAS